MSLVGLIHELDEDIHNIDQVLSCNCKVDKPPNKPLVAGGVGEESFLTLSQFVIELNGVRSWFGAKLTCIFKNFKRILA